MIGRNPFWGEQIWSFLKFLWRGSEQDEAGGLGQSFADEWRWRRKFIELKKQTICWRRATPDEQKEHDVHGVVARFGDMTYAVATLDGRKLIVRERLWNDFPDPPEFAPFVFCEDGALWCAYDFDWWPKTWQLD
jgi:hypothetical protein